MLVSISSPAQHSQAEPVWSELRELSEAGAHVLVHATVSGRIRAAAPIPGGLAGHYAQGHGSERKDFPGHPLSRRERSLGPARFRPFADGAAAPTQYRSRQT